jgi:hypothetical protein
LLRANKGLFQTEWNSQSQAVDYDHRLAKNAGAQFQARLGTFPVSVIAFHFIALL